MEFLPLIGGLMNNVFAGFRQSQAQDFATQQAAQAEAYFRTNRQTAYQDTMYSMREAGLNPILAYKQGPVSGTMGTTPSPSAAPVSDIGLKDVANTALAVTRQEQELKNMEATRQLTLRQAETEANRPKNVEADTARLNAVTGLTETEALKGLADAMQSKSLAEWIQNNQSLTQALMAASFVGGRVGEAAKPFVEAVTKLLGSIPTTPTPGNRTFNPNFGNPGSTAKSHDAWEGTGPIKGFNSFTGRTVEPAPPPSGGWFSDRFRGAVQ